MKDHHETHLYVPNAVYVKLKALAQKNRRTVNAETVIAIESHVETKQHLLRPSKRKPGRGVGVK